MEQLNDKQIERLESAKEHLDALKELFGGVDCRGMIVMLVDRDPEDEDDTPAVRIDVQGSTKELCYALCQFITNKETAPLFTRSLNAVTKFMLDKEAKEHSRPRKKARTNT